MRKHWMYGLVGVVGVVAAGCLRREETITVRPDRSVRLALKFEGHAKDFETSDALPSAASGWEVESKTTVEENGEVTRLLTGEREFGPGEELPSGFAAPGDTDADLYTAFATRVYSEERKDGVYLYFRRVYTPRPWAYANYWTDEFLDDSNRKLAERPVEELSRDERIQLVSGLVGVELFKQLEFAEEALKAADPDLPPEAWLKARAAVIEQAEEIDWGAFVDRVSGMEPEARDAQIEREAQRVQDEAYATLTRTLQEAAGYGKKEMARFEAAYARAEKRFDITNQTGGHNFLIRVKLPGELVAHNADKADDGYAVWEFSGKAFRDRPFELIAVSRLSPDSDRK